MDEVVANFDGVTRHPNLRVFRSSSGTDVVTPAVPWTLDERTVEVTLAERPAGMRTGIIQRIDASIDVAQGNPDASGFNSRTLSGRNVRYLHDRYPLHGLPNDGGLLRSACMLQLFTLPLRPQ